MARVSTVTLDDIVASLPDIDPFERVVGGVRTVDLLIAVSGFEPRLSAVTERLAELEVDVRRACYLTYDETVDENRRVRDRLLGPLLTLAATTESLAADVSEEEFARALRDIVAAASPADGRPPVVLLDISVASSRLLTRCVHVLMHANVTLLIGYTQAETYHPTRERFDQWKADRDRIVNSTAEALSVDARYDLGATPDTTLGLDYGAKDVEYLADFRVQHLETLPDRVIVIPGYNGARARAFLAQIDPALLDSHPNDAVTWLVGDPLLEHDKWRFHAVAAANSLVDKDGNTDDCAVPVTTFYYLDVLRTLGRIYETNFGAEKVTVCATGSKMQNLAAILFCELHPDVRLGQALPEKYTTDPYSEGVVAIWGIRLGATAELRDLLGTYGQAQIVDG